MSYNTLDQSSKDLALQNRVLAAVQKEAQANAELAATPFGELVRDNPAEGIRLMWPVCIDYESEYAYAVDHNHENPGGDEGVITDANIGSAVQAHWPQEAVP